MSKHLWGTFIRTFKGTLWHNIKMVHFYNILGYSLTWCLNCTSEMYIVKTLYTTFVLNILEVHFINIYIEHSGSTLKCCLKCTFLQHLRYIWKYGTTLLEHLRIYSWQNISENIFKTFWTTFVCFGVKLYNIFGHIL